MSLTPTETPGTAVVTWLRPATKDHAYLIDAVCQTCHRDVMHGGGDQLDDLLLGDRRVHCRCDGSYELVDANDVLPGRIATIRADEAARAARRAARSA